MLNQLMAVSLQSWAFMLVGALLVLALHRWGLLRRRAFKAAPRRNVNLHSEDLIIGLGLLVAGPIVLAQFAPSLVESPVDDPSAVEYAQRALAGQAAMLPLVAFVIWRVTGRPAGLVNFGLISQRPVHHIALGLLALMLAMPIVLGLGEAIQLVGRLIGQPPPEIAHDMLKVVSTSQSSVGIALLLIPAVFVAPVLEELIYRGLLQTALLDLIGTKKRWPVILAASLLFTVMHTSVAWQAQPILFVLALFLGWLYERTGSLWPPIVLHIGFNSLNFGWVVLAPSG